MKQTIFGVLFIMVLSTVVLAEDIEIPDIDAIVQADMDRVGEALDSVPTNVQVPTINIPSIGADANLSADALLNGRNLSNLSNLQDTLDRRHRERLAAERAEDDDTADDVDVIEQEDAQEPAREGPVKRFFSWLKGLFS